MGHVQQLCSITGGFHQLENEDFPFEKRGISPNKKHPYFIRTTPHFSEPGQEMRQMVEDLCAEVARSASLEDVVQRMDNQWITNG